MKTKLQDKVAVITGGNSGIGFAAAEEFKANGAQVVILGRNSDAVRTAAKKLGGNTLGVTADVSSVAEINAAFKAIRDQVGRVHILFVNASIAHFVPMLDSTEEFFDKMTDTNFKGAFFTIQSALPLMPVGSSIVLTSAPSVHFGVPGLSVYAAGKAALNSLAKTLAIELADQKIRVNVISPGPVFTPIYGKMGLTKEQVASRLIPQVPLGRFGEAKEAAKCALFLASDDSSFVTGQEVVMDGGMSQF